MPRKRSWTDIDLTIAVKNSKSVRSVIKKLGLIPAGGNYRQVQDAIESLALNTEHFTGMGWNKGQTYQLPKVRRKLEDILADGTDFQSYKLKQRLFESGLKIAECELCSWAGVSCDGRIPVELDHINGNNRDNRLMNLRILCLNCHSLQPTHRGKNKKPRSDIKTKSTLL